MSDAIARFKKNTVLVIGDIMLDRSTSGISARLSPEAPVPILAKTGDTFALGGAANVAHNVAALGARAILCGVVGRDADADVLLALAKKAGISSRAIVKDVSRPTTRKHRILADSIQVARLDTEDVSDISQATERALIKNIGRLVPRCDVVILSDYAKGVLTPRVVKAAIRSARTHKKKIVADIKPVAHVRFKGVDLVTPNIAEARSITEEHDAEKVGKKLTRMLDADVFLTRGKDGISVFGKKGSHGDVPAHAVNVYDVTGAGDAVTAVAALALAAGMPLIEVAQLANRAGGIVVQRPGTAVVTVPDLLATFTTHLDTSFAVDKVWGKELWLENNDKYCCKQLSIKKGYQCSLHYHKVKDEMFLVTRGHVRLELGKDVLYLREGNFVRVPTGVPHRFRGLEDSVMIEISTHHDEADSYRIKGEESRKADEEDD